jgi:hypothetical protein
MGRVALVVVALVVVVFGAQLVLDTVRQAKPAPSPTAAASVSATPAPTATPRPSPTPTSTYVPPPPPPQSPTVRISGSGPQNSRVFYLNDTVGYIARYTLGSSCQYDGYLQSTDGTYNNTDFITDTGPGSAAKILNTLPVNNYYIAMTTGRGCSWSVTFNPR